ncbi:DUF7511 domain-containing protein [Halostella litorea]|uniref:DUF7511 domain-containing protein n=1 Tax=Halostella litorea TaxID=2528831 RepID=UPI001091F37B|nr:hypothetical protein [Halostella litorea]
MSTNTPTTDSKSPGEELHAVTVENDGRPDECTLYPRGSTGIDRMSRWITVEADAVVDLDAVR